MASHRGARGGLDGNTDLVLGSISPLSQIPGQTNLRIVFQICRNRHVLCRTTIRPSDTPHEQMLKVQELQKALVLCSRRIISRLGLCHATFIGTARIIELNPTFIEAQLTPINVAISSQRRDDHLTAAYHGRDLLEYATSCFKQNDRNEFYFVGSEIDRSRVVFLILVAIILSAECGALVGGLTHDLGNGIGCFAGLVGFLSLLVALMMWFYM